MADGSFVGRQGRPPIFNTPQILTLFALTALDTGSPHSDQASPAYEKLKRSTAWLAQQLPDETHQGIVLQLWWHSMQSKSSTETARLIALLREQQRSDGGWAQAPELASDAFATGQTLYVLGRVGVQPDDAAMQRGIEFLVRTQREDGTWQMLSRPDPESKRGAENLNPITYAACAWAVLGLSSQVPAR